MPPMTTPTIAVLDRESESWFFCLLDPPVADAMAAEEVVKPELDFGRARTVTVVALAARLAMEVEISAGSG